MLHVLQGSHVVSAADSIELQLFLASQDQPERQVRQEPKPQKTKKSEEYDKAKAEVLAEYPWAAVERPPAKPKKKTLNGDWATQEEWDWLLEEVPEDIGEEEEEWLHRELEALSLTWHAELADACRKDFFVTFLKGKSTLKLTGMTCDAVRAAARGHVADEFFATYAMKTTRRWNIKMYDGISHCLTLAKAWCSKMQFFLQTWHSQPNPVYVFTDADLAVWVPSEDFSELEQYWMKDKKKFPTIQEILSMHPQLAKHKKF